MYPMFALSLHVVLQQLHHRTEWCLASGLFATAYLQQIRPALVRGLVCCSVLLDNATQNGFGGKNMKRPVRDASSSPRAILNLHAIRDFCKVRSKPYVV